MEPEEKYGWTSCLHPIGLLLWNTTEGTQKQQWIVPSPGSQQSKIRVLIFWKKGGRDPFGSFHKHPKPYIHVSICSLVRNSCLEIPYIHDPVITSNLAGPYIQYPIIPFHSEDHIFTIQSSPPIEEESIFKTQSSPSIQEGPISMFQCTV